MKYFVDSASTVTYAGISNVTSTGFTCGFCGKLVSPNQGYNIKGALRNVSIDLGKIYKCPNCLLPTFWNSIENEYIPGEKIGATIKELPDIVEKIYNECRSCFSHGCYTATIMLARKILMNLAVENDAEEGLNFFEYVEYLNDNNYIPPKGKDWVDYIRTQGNEANHEISIKEKEAAYAIIRFVEGLLRFNYEFNSLIPPIPAKT
jgi:hypothetical protein